jgi:hypothetical protein
MKNRFLLVISGLLFLISCKKAEDITNPSAITVIPSSSVPAAVLSTFNTNFSGATEIEWHKSSGEFESEFNHSGLRHRASFDDNGNQRSHSISCTDGPVPVAVLNAFRTTHPNDLVYEWKLNAGNWKAHFMRGAVKWEATYTAAGVLVSEEHS